MTPHTHHRRPGPVTTGVLRPGFVMMRGPWSDDYGMHHHECALPPPHPHPSLTSRFVIVPSAQDEADAAAAAAARADELHTSHSDVEHDRRNGPRLYHQRTNRRKRRSQRTASGSGGGGSSRRRSRSSASANASGYTDSEDSEGEGMEEEPSGVRRGKRMLGGARRIGISEVTFFTHLKFSAHLPDFQEMEACRHFVGPLHILQVRVFRIS